MESSIPLHCKLSPSTDTTMYMACSAALEPHFQVDDLLNFSNDEDDDADSALRSPLIPHATAAGLLFAPPLSAASLQMNKEEASLLEEPSHGLCVPPDELVHQLEWLSSFNEDNFFSGGGGDAKLLSPTTSSSQASSGLTHCKDTPIMTQRARDDFRSESPVSVLEHGGHAYTLNHHVHRASRIRKARTGGRVWSLDILKPILFDNRLKASYDSSSLLVTSCSSAYSEPLCSFLQPDDSERPYKKMKQVSAHDAISDSALVRKCTHCSVQKTPQWRAGPLGPKTLCNACGVRYKSGRLVPEYRPAASPSFINEVHSNSHRRILEMRRVKEVESSVKHHKSKVERAYKTDSKPESCRVLRISDEGMAKGMQNVNETLSSDGVSGCEDGVRRGDGICGEGISGKEDSIDGCFVSCEADIVSNAACVHKAPNSTSACNEEHMEESVHMEAVCEQDSFCGKGATAVMFELDTHQGHKVEARAQIDQDKNAAA